jgi:hypothetical protein
MDILEHDTYLVWTEGVRWQLAQSLPTNVTTYQPFLFSPLDFGNVVGKGMAVYGPSSGDLEESGKDDDTSSADDSDLSSVENKGDDLLSAERSGDDTSSVDDNDSSAEDHDLSSVEDNGDNISSFEGDDDDLSTAGAHDDESASDNITTLRPNNERPNISLDLIKDSTVASKLPGFLAQMRAANQELEEEKSAGTLASRRIELDESDSAAEGEQHIEMNLGLGVLEEKYDDTSTASESDSSNEEGDGDIMETLLGGKRKHGLEDEDKGAPKKAKIQEV